MLGLLGSAPVHTTGVNWDGILANAAAVIVIISAFGAIIVRQLRRSIADTVQGVVDQKIVPKLDVINDEIHQLNEELQRHDTRIARLEGVEEGKQMAAAAAQTVTVPIAESVKTSARKR